MRFLPLILGLLASPVAAHEFWIEPLAYQVEADGRLEGHLVNGEEFAGAKLPYLPQRFENFVLFNGEQADRVRGRPGDSPALNVEPLGEGLHIVAYQARNATVNYENWEKFQRFVDHKDFGDILSAHEARGLAMENFGELYSRYSKTLIGVGNAEGADRRVGLETEIVALTNPYTDDISGGMQVQVFYRNDVRADVQIEIFEKDATGNVAISYYRTNADGIGTFPVKPGFEYMVDAVVLREPNAEESAATGTVWETLWANLTFAVPE
jgi:hypothetical protein